MKVWNLVAFQLSMAGKKKSSRNCCIVIHRKKYFYCRIYPPLKIDHDALQIYSNMLYTGSTVSICSFYSNNAVKTTEICYSALTIASQKQVE